MITFLKIRWKNLLSTGNQFTEVILNETRMKLFVGKNGHGKSTLLDALCFALYNSSFRDINKPQLVNSKNGKNTLTELWFNIGKDEYFVRRGMKPTIFEIHKNGVLVPQDANSRDYQDILVSDILKMNLKTFKQVVILGSRSYIPFMKLKPADRREVLEDMWDLKIYTTMSAVCKRRVEETNRAIQDCEMEIRFANENIEHEKKLKAALRENNDERIAELDAEIVRATARIEEEKERYEQLGSDIHGLLGGIDDEGSIQKELDEGQRAYQRVESKIAQLDSDIDFYRHHDNCPTCHQVIEEGFRCQTIEAAETERELRLSQFRVADTYISKRQTRLQDIQDTKSKINGLYLAQTVHRTNINALEENINKMRNEINGLQTKNQSIDASDENLVKWQGLLADETTRREQLLAEQEVRKAATLVLKDSGIKAQRIKQNIDTVNKLINKNLAALDFYVKFELDANFKETIKSRYRDEFSYESFSEGQKMRIDLAILFAWRAIAKQRNSAATNLLIMDEVFESSLDLSGLEDVLKLMHKLTGETNTIVISPRGDAMHDKFDKIYNFEMTRDFSKMKVVK